MPKVLTGVLAEAREPKIKRGTIECSALVFNLDSGEAVTWKAVSMDRKVFDALRLNRHATFYGTRTWSTLYGVRPDGEAGVFACWAANPLALVVSIGMIAMGLGTAPLVFPLLAVLAGIAGVCLCLDAGGAQSRFRRDQKASETLGTAG